MSANPTFVFSPMLIFILVGGLIVLAMAMGRKNQQGHRAGVGWWVSLGLLLVVVSGFLGYSRLRVSPVFEERHIGRNIFNRTMSDAPPVQAGVSEKPQGFQSAQEILREQVLEAKRARESRASNAKAAAMVSLTAPKSSVEWTIEVKGNERRQSMEEVAQVLREKVTSSVNKWVLDRMPIKSIWFHTVDEAWLEQHGVFDSEIKYDTVGVPRLDPKLKDTLYSGAMTVVLNPSVQVELLEKGYSKLELTLQDEKFQGQFAIFFILLVLTGLAALLGTVKSMAARRAYARQLAKA